MKKCLFVIAISLLFITTSVNASSISYNLSIDNTLKFHEKNVYTINDSDIKTNGSYNFLTSVVNDNIYFDSNNEIPYTKTKTKTANGYVVTLTHDYSNLFFTSSRIAKECFGDVQLINNEDGLRFTASSPFYCEHRADDITINVTTDLTVKRSNADVVNNHTYTWNKINSNLDIRFDTGTAVREEQEALDDLHDYDDEEQNNNPNGTNSDNENENKVRIDKSTFGIIVIGLFVITVILAFILKKKNGSLNKI